ncbi:bifunctional pantoate--beta-alanine ligase/(d)CMP kinase [Chlorogloea sp. CCALA 695]|uniref:bifunctional pantoate--beta-alanine ligase/(d)CMP kinase n=1 Tax=Chlorogloea sp. CCALA 695 TaxID=2107693 RepID=UPI000D0677BD|nr:bifunctional pantoate--beta-alanine ligase/(d)CMP kinase [Chlorogloea sp. CCALA 695]PSB33479.1 cytidylate kinase [Chlorogloea sp. CCALA 695]
MRLFTTVAALRCYLKLYQKRNQSPDETDNPSVSIGLVPTMGALHWGHLSLIARAKKENDLVIVSIFVNPLQFAPTEDYQSYPRTLERDRLLCQQSGVDAIFAPEAQELGVNEQLSSRTQVVPPSSMTSVLCGKTRLGHFQGVATIVTQLFNIVQPNKAYFGQKDAQQVAIIRRLVKDLNFSVKIVTCPTVRETSGLAKSSRNQYLTPVQIEQAAVLNRSLQQAKLAFQAGERDRQVLEAIVNKELATVECVAVEYVELVEPDTLMPLEKIEDRGLLAISVRVGSARLIDNVLLKVRSPIVAIDGPAGAGKSTVARLVAAELGLVYLDTGAMYRALTFLVLQSGISVDDERAIAQVVSNCSIQLSSSTDDLDYPVRVWINGEEVTQVIRSAEVTANVSAIASQKAVRSALLQQQQSWGLKGGLVAEGRDIGTHVFPNAELKVFLTASVSERARRRQQDFQTQGQVEITLEQLEQTIQERDRADSTRELAPLQKAPDAIELCTDGLSINQVINKIISLYHEVVI